MYLPILMYHRLADRRTSNSYILTKEDFEQHLRVIVRQGLLCLTAEELLASYPSSSRAQKVLITFDDGHDSDFFHALPLLQKYGCKATFFVTSDWIDTPGYMRPEQLRELQAAGMSIQAHGKTHQFLDGLGSAEVHRELFLAKRKLEAILARPVACLSCPGGRYSREVLRRAGQAGYRAVFTSSPYGINKGRELLVAGRRVMRYLPGGGSVKDLTAPGGAELCLRQAAYLAKVILRKLMGQSLYYWSWSQLMKK